MGSFQCVSTNYQCFTFLPILSGVSQGGRPMLYMSYVNDFPKSIKYSHTLIFADDIKCILPISSCQDSTTPKLYL